MLKIKDEAQGKYGLVSLGEVMLRLDPGEGRIRNSRVFRAWEGGGEYNVARGLRKCFGVKTAIVTSLVENDVGRLIEDFIMQGGVDTEFIQWVPFDGIGRTARNGINFTERGFGVRGALGVSDRAHSAAGQMKLGSIDWERIFSSTRWFHTGGIFAALSDDSSKLALEAVKAAKRCGCVVSYDLNYRPSLWKERGGQKAAIAVNSEIAEYVDVMLGNEEDFSACLGYEVDSGVQFNELNISSYEKMMQKVSKDFSNFEIIASTLRTVKSASRNDWSAVCWADNKAFRSDSYPDLEVLDRVGGGDSFASGFIYGMLTSGDPAIAVKYGAAHGALAMTTPGDTSMASLREVENLVAGKGSRIQR